MTVRVEDADGEPVPEAEVRVRPCYTGGVCDGDDVLALTRSASAGARVRSKSATVETFRAGLGLSRTVSMYWLTVSETNNAGFDLLRKGPDESSFTEIGFVEGAGTTDETQEYEYRTEPLPEGPNEIRLAAVNAEDGTRTIIGTRTVEVRSVEPGFTPPAPNPSRVGLIMSVRTPERARVSATAHALDGSQVDVIEEGRQLTSIQSRLSWQGETVPDGLYAIRTALDLGEERGTVRDTVHLALIRSTADAPMIGTTTGDGAVTTRDRTLFPAVIDQPAFEARTGSDASIGTLRLTPTVEFIVRTDAGTQTLRRTVADQKNTVTLSVSP